MILSCYQLQETCLHVQMPYLLDLHLYLSRPLQPAPVQPIHQAAAAAAALPNDISMFGTIPQASHSAVCQHFLKIW